MRTLLRALIVAPLAAALIGLVHVPAAHASLWQLSDGFEVNPTATWSCWNSVDDPVFVNGCNRQFVGGPNPHGGVTTGWIQVHSGWSDIGRPVSLSPFLSGRTLNCAARIYGKMLTFNTQLHGQLEVIDVATWTYVSVKPFTLFASVDFLKWRAITTSTWIPPRKNVFVRIGLIGEYLNELDALEVDDLIVQCQYN